MDALYLPARPPGGDVPAEPGTNPDARFKRRCTHAPRRDAARPAAFLPGGGVGEFAEPRREEGNAAHTIAGHLGSRGASLHTVSPSEQSTRRLLPALAVSGDAEKPQKNTKRIPLLLQQSKLPLPRLERCQGRAGWGEVLAWLRGPCGRTRTFFPGPGRVAPLRSLRGGCRGGGPAAGAPAPVN